MAILDEVLQTLEIQPTGIPTVVRLSQNENGRQIRLTLRGQETNFPAGCVVTIAGTKPDGVVYSAEGTLDGNVAVIDEDTQMTAVSGMWKARVNVTYGGSTIATELIVFEVYADPVDPGSVPSESELNGLVAEAQYWAENARSSAYGSPLVASTAADMVETDRVYVYTGSEDGYTAGDWYYYDGSAWVDGGIYNAAAVQTDTTLSVPGMAADAQAVGQKKASIDGAYTDLTAGTAEAVLSEVYDVDKVPYHLRSVPHKSRRLMDMIVGGSVVWNQLVQNGNFADGITNWTVGDVFAPTVTDGVLTLTMPDSETMPHVQLRSQNLYFAEGHKILVKAKLKSTNASNTVAVRANTNATISGTIKALAPADTWLDYGVIISAPSGNATPLMLFCVSNSLSYGDIIQITDVQAFDLTAMFDSTIADHIYNLEQTTAGAGVSLFRSLFPADFYAYNTGEIKSVSGLSAHKMRDADNNVIATYPLDSDLTLRGILKKDSNNRLYFDGDTYESDGTVTRRYGTRAYQSGDESLTDTITDGTTTVYKLTTATTETAQPYQEIQICNPDGTEEYVSTGIVPVGHETKYYRDLDLVIPAPPTTDGTYTLQCTVSGGVASYAWV